MDFSPKASANLAFKEVATASTVEVTSGSVTVALAKAFWASSATEAALVCFAASSFCLAIASLLLLARRTCNWLSLILVKDASSRPWIALAIALRSLSANS